MGDVTTERLELRRFRSDDIDPLSAVFAKEEVWRYPHGRAFSREETEAFIRAQQQHWADFSFGLWVAALRGDSRIIGYVGLAVPTFLPEILPAVEVGWRFDPEVWGRGYATEGATAALNEAFSTLGLRETCSLPQSDNLASVRVAERLGMRLEREIVIPANDRHSSVTAAHYSISRDQWLAPSHR
jgi:RimJ/RimL family protein N-acetyltransferase